MTRGRESHEHGESLDALKPACKARKRQRPVISGNRAEPTDVSIRTSALVRQPFGTSALARLEAALDLIDDVNPALAADQTVVAMTTAQRFQGVTDLHGTFLML
jgi:hypothetical protein